jgi:molybdate transport system ATP-binding protein
MSARDNVAFGLRARGVSRAAAHDRADEWLDRFGLTDHADARPDALSGGQAQRVALARALATEPGLLLLDEPLAALDATTRVHVRAELRRHLATFAGVRILVTHDPVDALVLADRLVIVEAGRVTQSGTPAQITSHPATRYVADLVGINLLHGRLHGSTVRLDGGAELVVAPPEPVPDGDVALAIRPQAIALYPQRPDGSPRNTWEATVDQLEADRDRIRVSLAGPIPVTAEVTAGAAASLDLRPGRRVWASTKAVDIAVYER